MRDSWIDEVHMSASWLCSLFLSHLLSLGSSDRSHNGGPWAMGQDHVGPSSKILASRSNSSLGRTNGSGLALAVGVYGLF